MADLREAEIVCHVAFEKPSPLRADMPEDIVAAWGMICELYPDMAGCKLILCLVKDSND